MYCCLFWIDDNSEFHILETESLKKGEKINEMLNSPFGIWNAEKGRFEIIVKD